MQGSNIAILRGLEPALADGSAQPAIDQAALEGLKFSAALPLELAERTLRERGSDTVHASAVSRSPLIVR